MERRKTEGEGMLAYRSRVFGEVPVRLKVQQYQDNGCLYVGLDCMEDGCLEPFGNVTVNLPDKAPDYCGYCTYPLYLFHADRIRELCPEGMAAYEEKIRTEKKPETKEHSR